LAAERDTRAAKRYATALFEVAEKQNKLDTIVADLKTVQTLTATTPALLALWQSRIVPASTKRDVLTEILSTSIDELTLSFVRLLIDKRREAIFDQVIVEIGRLADASQRLVRADATFAVAPSDAETASLIEGLEKRTGERVQLTVAVDPEILGGVVVRLHDTIIDGSVRGALEGIRERLLQEA